MLNASSEIGTIDTGKGEEPHYIGRFAPSPTGPLHFGSLLAAVASYLQARAANGTWLLRVEDIDPPREQPGATDRILEALEAYGFEWDGPCTFQSQSRDEHEAAIRTLIANNLAYPCGCSRRDLDSAPRGTLGVIYPGYCRDGCDYADTAIRVRTDNRPIHFEDELQGGQLQRLESESGDFIIRRRDGLVAYQLAVVVDDYLQNVTEIVRGIDLIDSTARQIWLQGLLGYPQPGYVHIPVAVNSRRQKLSKSHGAGAVSLAQVSETLEAALKLLGQEPPAELRHMSVKEIWCWATTNWNVTVLRGLTEIAVGNLQLANSENQFS